ncbi:TRAP transporter small permease [Fulvimarina endophytica]|uniref:TRAP transporter small permease protein n=2 Tax=Fulvimarina endophytica TaxID=2293836 RepID=A0A371WZ68_9HYPH|nr:TRAP transporter small permease [Fulvimarina endophytica]
MKGPLTVIRKGIDGINWVAGWLLAALLAVMIVLIAWQVFARYVMGSPLAFSEEIARFSMVWMTLLGAGYAFRQGTLISIDLVAETAGPTLRRAVIVLVTLISMVFAYVLLTQGWFLASRISYQTAPSTGLSMLWLYGAIPAGAILIMINGLALLIDQYLGDEPAARTLGQAEPTE